MKAFKYKGFVIVGKHIWFDHKDEYKKCRSFMSFATKDQIYEFIDEFHEKYMLLNDRYTLRR